MAISAPRFSRGDVDGFFGLFVDNLLQLMLIAVLCPLVAGIPAAFVAARILPGAAVSILLGNVYYARQARRLMAATGRTDVTALPYGINTPSVFAYIFLIMGPVYRQSGDWHSAWVVGLWACLLSGLMEAAGAFVGDWLRRHTPRAALLAALAGVAITFIAMGFVFQLFAAPWIGVLPMLIVLAGYAGRVRLPLGLPAGFAAVLCGTLLAWGLRALGVVALPAAAGTTAWGLHPPLPALGELWAAAQRPEAWTYLAVIVPMGLFNVIGSLQNLESAEAAGDAYPTRPSLLVNGVGSLVAAALGSAFPTTIYIGHPGWKALGARSGYSLLNGAVITALCLAGGVGAVLQVVPLEATLGILLWIGVIMTAQAFTAVPARHAVAVAVGLIPSLAAWALVLIETTLRAAGGDLVTAAPHFGGDLAIGGVISLSQGFLLTAMLLAAIVAHAVDRAFDRAAMWCLAAAVLAALGFIHAYDLTAAGVANHFGLLAAPGFAAAYLAAAGVMLLLRRRSAAVSRAA